MFDSFSKLGIVTTAALLTTIGLAAPPSLSQSSRPNPSKVNPAVERLNKLKTCTPATYSGPHPFNTDYTIYSVIKGWENDRCLVENTVRSSDGTELKGAAWRCRYSRRTIALQTDKKAYEQAASGNYSSDSSDPRDAALSEALSRECEFNAE